MKYLCIFDMDETLLSPDKSISPENKAALRKLTECNVGISIATGRSPFFIRKQVEMLSLKLPVIACNGGMIVTCDNSRIIWENPIHKQTLKNLFHYFLDQHADFLAYSGKMVYFAQNSFRVGMFHEYNRTVPPHMQVPLQEFSRADLELPLPDINKILLYNPQDMQVEYLRSIPGLEVVFSMNKSLDIMQAGSTKGRAVLALGSYLGIPAENIAVFGDNENDISMFTSGALGIAMGNSSDEVKQKARYVTGTNRESGVAQGIYKYVLPYFGLTP